MDTGNVFLRVGSDGNMPQLASHSALNGITSQVSLQPTAWCIGAEKGVNVAGITALTKTNGLLGSVFHTLCRQARWTLPWDSLFVMCAQTHGCFCHLQEMVGLFHAGKRADPLGAGKFVRARIKAVKLCYVFQLGAMSHCKIFHCTARHSSLPLPPGSACRFTIKLVLVSK